MRGSESRLIEYMEGAKKRFVIPVYQRNYNWKTENCKQLFDDLLKIIRNGRKSHFFGSIVSVFNPDGRYTEFLVIDGQQRLTTVSLLLLAIYNLTKEGVIIPATPSLTQEIYEGYLVDKFQPEETRIKLKPVKNDQRALGKLFEDKKEHIKDSNLTANYSYFYDRIQKQEITIDELFDAICRLEVIDIRLNNEDNPQLIFESLNSTGLDLSEGDKIRNFVLMGLPSKEQEVYYEKYWNRIEECTGYDASSFIRDYLSLKQQSIPSQKRVYVNFKEYVELGKMETEPLLRELLGYAQRYQVLLKGGTASKALNVEQMRKHYLGHLTDVVMVDSHTLTAERLGGADFDGDMIKTISAPILNTCVKRNYQDYSSDITRQTNGNIPLLKIPTVEPQIRDANDWYARFETVRNTFSSRVGQISNAALDRSVIAYNENSDSELQQRCREETEILAILTGLEIDSAKNGVKPDLSEYLNKKVVNRSLFLQYKKLLESAEVRGKWYEPTFREKRKEFFEKTDWSKVDSNLERLPYLAYQLRRNTPKLKPKPAKDSELFDFAREPGWTEKLDPHILSSVSAFLSDYEACLSRIRACRVPVQNKQRKNDIERILFSRGQEDTYDSDELYATFQDFSAERIAEIRAAIVDSKWHFMDSESRFDFLESYLPELEDYHELFADFRYGGYRILGDLICDIDDENRATDRKKYLRDTDSDSFHQMMNAYLEQPLRYDYREVVASKCRELLDRVVRPRLAVQYVVALGKRNLLWELLIDHIEESVLKEEPHAE